MRIAHIARTLLSGGALYLVMAACGASHNGGGAGADDGGAMDAFGDNFGDALVDALIAPVKDAKADPLPPDVVV